MPIFKPNITQQYGPKTIKLSDLYRHATKNKLSTSTKANIMSKLASSGYSDDQIKSLFTKGISANRAKEVASHLSQNNVSGFMRSPGKLVDDYIRHEALKNRNVARVKHELSIEARQEPLENIIKPTTIKTPKSSPRKLF